VQNDFVKKLSPIVEQLAVEACTVFNASESGIAWAAPGLDLTPDVIRSWTPSPSRAANTRVLIAECKLLKKQSAFATLSDPEHPHSPRPSLLPAAVLSWTRLPSTTGRRLVAVKNVTVNEEFSGHFRGAGAARRDDARIAVAGGGDAPAASRGRAQRASTCAASATRSSAARCSRAISSGSRSRSGLGGRRWRARAAAIVGDQVVAEPLLLASSPTRRRSIMSAIDHPGAQIGRGTTVGAHAIIGPQVRSANCRIGASAVIDGRTELGDDCEVYPFASIANSQISSSTADTGWTLQHLSRFVTVHAAPRRRRRHADRRSQRVVHVAHDCHVGDTSRNMAALGSHVNVEDYVNISAGSGVHQFCRVGRHVHRRLPVVTKDALPFARTVGNRPARIYGGTPSAWSARLLPT
jgi:UDP-N-acetylglucosamine acyltransferase